MYKRLIALLILVFFSSCDKHIPSDQDVSFAQIEFLQQQLNVTDDEYVIRKAYHINSIVSDKISNLSENEKVILKQEHQNLIDQVREYFTHNLEAAENLSKKYSAAIYELSKYIKEDGSQLLIVPAAYEESEKVEALVFIHEKMEI